MAAALGAVLALGACSSSVQPSRVATNASIAISGITLFSASGQTSQLTAMATTADGRTANVSDQSSWRCSNTLVATVSPTGLVTAEGVGQAEISVAYQGLTSNVTVFVSPPPPQR